MAWLTSIILFVGAGMIVLAAVGSLKFPDTLTRMAAVSKSSTFGAVLFCLAAAMHFERLDLALSLLLAAFILFLGIPISSYLLSRLRVQRRSRYPIHVHRNDLDEDERNENEKA